MRKRVAVFLQGRATKADSRLLQRVAAKLTEAGPFDKVRQMIADMITKLSQEAAEEADHKAWCDGELKGNKQTRDAKSEEVDRLTARGEKLTAQIQQLATEIAALNDEVSAAQAALAEATAQRNKEHAENTEAVADAKAAIVAVTEALKVLNDTKKDMKATQEELDAALAYYDKLKPNCIDAGVSYKERVQRREEEVESLREALKI